MKLLDSTVLVDIDRGGDTIKDRAQRLDQEGRHAISSVTITELFYGIEEAYGDREGAYTRAVGALDTLVERFVVLPVSRPVAKKAARLIHRLKTDGKALNDLHDVYIAATALVNELVVMTSNTKHFRRFEDLVVDDWASY